MVEAVADQRHVVEESHNLETDLQKQQNIIADDSYLLLQDIRVDGDIPQPLARLVTVPLVLMALLSALVALLQLDAA